MPCKYSPGWVNNIFEIKGAAKFKSARAHNEMIATRTLSKVFLACWIVLKTFIDVVKQDNQGTLPSSILHDWLLFQLHPADIPDTEERPTLFDPFTRIVVKLSGASQATLTDLVAHYSDQVLAIIKVKSFFCVIDEAQVAGEEYKGAFSSSDGKTERPVLRPLVGYFKKHQVTRLIVSGTGFSLSLFTEVMNSNISKATKPPFVDHFTGNFFEQEAQLSYVARYLPHTYLDSESGKHLKTRIRRWLRGRCVATKVLESQLNRPL